jgi:HK97 family phage portal protein
VAKRSAVAQLIDEVRGIRNLARPIPFASRYNQTGGLYGSGAVDRFSMLQASGGTGTMFAIIQLLSTGAQAYGGWKMYRTDQDGRVRYARTDKGSDQRIEVMHHQAMKLWNRPNPFMTGEHFREIGWQHMELVGEWYWVLNRGTSGNGIPTEIWPVRPDRMEPVADRDKYLAGWVYTGPNGEQVPLETGEVIQLKYPDPSDIYRGRSAVQALLADIDANKFTAQYTRNFFLNSAVPGGVVIFNKRLTDVEFNEFHSRWRSQHQGVARGHRVGVLEQGAQWVPNTYTMRDMQFVELRSITSDEMRRAYRIHQAMLGDSTDVNRANAQTAEEVHISWHEIPRLRRLKTILNAMYLPMFSNTAAMREFDYDDPSPTSANDANDELTAKSKAAQVLVEIGFDPEDVLEVVGLPAMRFSGILQKASGGLRPDQPALPSPATPPEVPARLGHPELHDDMDITRNVASWIDEEYEKIKMEQLELVG